MEKGRQTTVLSPPQPLVCVSIIRVSHAMGTRPHLGVSAVYTTLLVSQGQTSEMPSVAMDKAEGAHVGCLCSQSLPLAFSSGIHLMDCCHS